MSHRLGYARISLVQAGCYRSFVDTASGSLEDRPELAKVLDQLRPGDTLVVWRLDRLGRSLRHLIDTVATLSERGIGLCSLQESIDTTTAGGQARLPCLRRAGRIRARPPARAHSGRYGRSPGSGSPGQTTEGHDAGEDRRRAPAL